MLSQYAAHFGVLVTYGRLGHSRNPIRAVLFFSHRDPTPLNGLGFNLNTNRDAPIEVKSVIRKSIEEVVGDYRTRNESTQDVKDIFYELGELGKTYVHRSFGEYETRPVLFISNEAAVDLDIWEEVATFKARDMINAVTKATVPPMYEEEEEICGS